MERFLKWCVRFAAHLALILTGKVARAIKWVWFWGAVALCLTGGALIGIPMLLVYGAVWTVASIGRGVLEAKRRADGLPPRR